LQECRMRIREVDVKFLRRVHIQKYAAFIIFSRSVGIENGDRRAVGAGNGKDGWPKGRKCRFESLGEVRAMFPQFIVDFLTERIGVYRYEVVGLRKRSIRMQTPAQAHERRKQNQDE